jgi:hypothetical protein
MSDDFPELTRPKTPTSSVVPAARSAAAAMSGRVSVRPWAVLTAPQALQAFREPALLLLLEEGGAPAHQLLQVRGERRDLLAGLRVHGAEAPERAAVQLGEGDLGEAQRRAHAPPGREVLLRPRDPEPVERGQHPLAGEADEGEQQPRFVCRQVRPLLRERRGFGERQDFDALQQVVDVPERGLDAADLVLVEGAHGQDSGPTAGRGPVRAGTRRHGAGAGPFRSTGRKRDRIIVTPTGSGP